MAGTLPVEPLDPGDSFEGLQHLARFRRERTARKAERLADESLQEQRLPLVGTALQEIRDAVQREQFSERFAMSCCILPDLQLCQMEAENLDACDQISHTASGDPPSVPSLQRVGEQREVPQELLHREVPAELTGLGSTKAFLDQPEEAPVWFVRPGSHWRESQALALTIQRFQQDLTRRTQTCRDTQGTPQFHYLVTVAPHDRLAEKARGRLGHGCGDAGIAIPIPADPSPHPHG
ncbi:hypothetical protein HRbin27_00893 [bacterium HR27]|nr:hypothetical protein HRbin27_00893 [bacterium HR27]